MQAVHSTSALAFAQLARGYCGWCEGPALGPNPEAQAAYWLARLYATALGLPSADGVDGDAYPDLPAADLAQAEKNLGPFSGWYYRECLDPDPLLSDEPGMGDLGDDLLDIYADVKRGLLLFDCGKAHEAVRHWSFFHKVHWGRHAVGGLFALHCLHLSKTR